MATGFTAEQLLEMFSAGYTLEKPDYSKSMEEAENLGGITQPNEPLTLEQLREMNGEPVWGKSLIKDRPGEWFILRIVEMSKTWFVACAGSEQGFGDKDTYGETWIAYRRPPEEGEKT